MGANCSEGILAESKATAVTNRASAGFQHASWLLFTIRERYALKCAYFFRARVCVQPCEQRTYAAGGQGNAGISGSVIQVNGISVRADRLPAGKHDVFHISASLITGFRPEHPGVSRSEERRVGRAESVRGA